MLHRVRMKIAAWQSGGKELRRKPISQMTNDEIDSLVVDCCGIPPDGWFCTRGQGHAGPCAARPNLPKTDCP